MVLKSINIKNTYNIIESNLNKTFLIFKFKFDQLIQFYINK